MPPKSHFRKLRPAIGGAVLSLCLAGAGGASAGPARQAEAPVGPVAPLVFSGLRPPVPFRATDGRVHLTYVLRIENGISVPVRVDRIVVRDAGPGGEPIATFRGPALRSQLALLASPQTPLAGAAFGPSEAGAFWVDVALPRGRRVPARLSHTITSTPLKPSPVYGRSTATAAPLDVARPAGPSIAPPLSGADWIVITGCCTQQPAHRHALFALGGSLFGAQEFAIDVMRRDAGGRLYSGPRERLESYAAYGAPVLAVADGTVVEIGDDLPDQVPGAPVPVRPAQADGNFVWLRLDDGRYANYAHLKPGSVQVRPGLRVRRGDRLALVGNSGQTAVPHLHFHLMDRPYLFAAVGLPFEFADFTLQGVPALAAADSAVTRGTPLPVPAAGAGARHNEMPLNLAVLTFPG